MAVSLVLLTCNQVSFADTQKASDMRALLEGEINSGAYDDLFDAKPKKLNCNVPETKDGLPMNKDHYDRYSDSEGCIIFFNRECNGAGEPEGYWGVISQQIHYINYMRKMAQIYNIKSHSFNYYAEMYNADINNSIELKLKYEKKPSKLNDIDVALSTINLEEALANSWEEYRNQLPENVKKDIPKGSYVPMGCAGEMAVILEFDILPSYFAVISEFGWTLCKARGIDPWNTSDCADWDVSPIDEIYIIGRYKFISKWADGTKLYSSINTMLSSPAYNKKITIRKSDTGEVHNAIEFEPKPKTDGYKRTYLIGDF
ncbi:hypothetical protein V2E67_000406 [Citrobacter freundii]|nr:hypothetical protein [Citrobacter freundii]